MPCDPWTRKSAEHFVNSEWACSGIIVNGNYYGPSEQGEIEDARQDNIEEKQASV